MILFCEKTYFIPLFNTYIYFLNGHSDDWLCNIVDFGPQVSCTCVHVILNGTSLSCPLSFREKSGILARRLHAAAPESILNYPGCLLPYTPSYMYDMPNVYFEELFLVTLILVLSVTSHNHCSHPV